MTCRRFEGDVSDWAGGRLCPEDGRRMADHARGCAACARAARAERRLRQGWREARDVPPAADPWPRLAARLRERPPGRDTGRGSLAWAWSAAALAAVMVLGLHPRPAPAPPPAPAAAVSPPPADPGRGTLHPAASGEEPDVDDPVGASMDEVWTQLDTRGAPQRG